MAAREPRARAMPRAGSGWLQAPGPMFPTSGTGLHAGGCVGRALQSLLLGEGETLWYIRGEECLLHQEKFL